MEPIDFGDPVTLPVAPPAGQISSYPANYLSIWMKYWFKTVVMTFIFPRGYILMILFVIAKPNS